MRYLTIYLNDFRLVCIDLAKPDRSAVKDAIDYVKQFNLPCFISNHRNIFTATYRRTGEGADETKSRLIKREDSVTRLKPEQALAHLKNLLSRGRDRAPRKMHPNSLKNLQPAPPFTTSNRPTRQRKISDALLTKATELRSKGASWRQVEEATLTNYESIRTALKRRGTDLH
jgi:hypothetical protein